MCSVEGVLPKGSFADAANNHGFKRARWRRLWRQRIQDCLIAATQNIRILLSRTVLGPVQSVAQAVLAAIFDGTSAAPRRQAALKTSARWN